MRYRGFTLTETIVIFAVLGVLMSIGWATFQAVESHATGSRTTNELVQISSSLAAWELARGYFPTHQVMATVEPQFKFVGENASMRSGEYSTKVVTIDGTDVLGIASVADSGMCYTITQPPLDVDDVSSTRQRFQSSPANPCEGAAAFMSGSSEW